MKKIYVAAVMAVSLGMVGCAPGIKPINEVKFYPKPSKEEAKQKSLAFSKLTCRTLIPLAGVAVISVMKLGFGRALVTIDIMDI